MLNFDPVNELLQKRMSRKDFLKHLAAIAVSMIGVTAFIRNLSSPLKGAKTVNKSKASTGYGTGSAYGR